MANGHSETGFLASGIGFYPFLSYTKNRVIVIFIFNSLGISCLASIPSEYIIRQIFHLLFFSCRRRIS